VKIAVFGATGPTGREIVRQALSSNHEVHALARNPSKLTAAAGLTVVPGDALNATDVEAAMRDAEAVIVTLGGTRGDTRPLAIATRHIIEVMKRRGQRRLIVITSLGVGDSKGDAGFLFEKLIVPLFLRDEFRDKEEQEKAVFSSKLDFVVVRPGGLQNGLPTGTIEAAPRLSAKSRRRIVRADVARFCLDQLSSDIWLGRAVSLSN
jgi:putative NADH-flavin reductase